MPVISYKDSYLKTEKPRSKEQNKQHFKNKRYNLCSWVTDSGKKMYQVNGKLVHSNEFKEILSREFPGQNYQEPFVLDFKLKTVKDIETGKTNYYCNNKKVSADRYVELRNQQRNDFLKAIKSTFNDCTKRGENIPFVTVRDINDVLNAMLDDFEIKERPKSNSRSSSALRSYLDMETKKRYEVDNADLKGMVNLDEGQQIIGGEQSIGNTLS